MRQPLMTPQQRVAVHLELDAQGDELRRPDDTRLVLVPGWYVIPWPTETLAGPFEDAEAANEWANSGNGEGRSL
jgi:hypothetical protein